MLAIDLVNLILTPLLLMLFIYTPYNSLLYRANQFKNLWPKERPNYLHFLLHKENRDTTGAKNSIANRTPIS